MRHHRTLRPPSKFRKAVALLLIPLAFACDGSSGAVDRRPPPKEAERPNVLVILTDDQTIRGTMKVLRSTRRIFADEGTRYANAVTTTPVCCPSRSSIFSGRYVHNHGVRNNDAGHRLDHEMTMQQELSAAGYKTAIVGKFLNHWTDAPPRFDRWAMFERGYDNRVFNVDGTKIRADYSTSFIRDYTLELLTDFERDDSRPWLLFVTPYAPHITSHKNRGEMVEDIHRAAPVRPLPQTPAMTDTGASGKPAFLGDSPSQVGYVQSYYKRSMRSLLSVDDLVDDVFQRLEELDEADDTLAFFASDNGFMWGEHGLIKKNLPYDQSVRIPFYVRWPGRVQPGLTDKRIVANIDIAPTVFAAADIEPAYSVDGRDVFSSDRRAILLENFSVPRHPDIPSWRAQWTPRSLFVEWQDPNVLEHYRPGDPWQLENVYDDGAEDNEFPRERARQRWLQDAARCSGTSCP